MLNIIIMFFRILLSFFLVLISNCVFATNINVANFDELLNSNPQNGDTITFIGDLTSDASIGTYFENLNITFVANNYYINGLNTHGGFILKEGSNFTNASIINCKGQQYSGSYYAGAIYNESGHTDVKNSSFNGNFVDSGGLYFSVGGAVYNLLGGEMNIDSTIFSNNYGNAASAYGGAVANGYQNDTNVHMTISNSVFKDNYAIGSVLAYGGALYNDGVLEINSSAFDGNYADSTDGFFGYGGAVYNIGNMQIDNSLFDSNHVDAKNAFGAAGGAIYNNSNMTISNSLIKNNFAGSDTGATGGAIFNDASGTLTIENSTLEGNYLESSDPRGGAIGNKGTLIILSSMFKNNYENSSTPNDIYNEDGVIKFEGSGTTSILDGINGTGEIYKNDSGVLNLGGDNQNYNGNFIFNGGTINLLSNSTYFDAQNTTLANGVNFNMQNGQINNVNFNNLTLSGYSNIFPDVNFSTNTMDTVSATSLGGTGGIIIPNLLISGAPKANFISIPFANSVLKNSISYTPRVIQTPIYNYNSSYNSSSGNFDFSKTGFYPGILAGEVATQIAGYLGTIDTFYNVFSNLDMVMVMEKDKEIALKYKDKYAAKLVSNPVFSPLSIPEDNMGVWFKPYSVFENVPLKNGPKVSNVTYGTMFGGESELKKLKKGFYGLFGAYASYSGSHQAYEGIGIYNNGGLAGVDGALYKGGFFTLWSANVGANSSKAHTLFGTENFAMLNTGVSQRTGYNFSFFRNKLILQPSIMTSYVFVNTFDYTNASGLDINTNPLNAIHIEPQIKLIGNFKNFIQPYLSVSVAWNIIDKTKFKVNDVYLSNLSVKPYVKYGIGVQKRFGERLTGFFETMFRSGGRNGVGLQLGLRFSI